MRAVRGRGLCGVRTMRRPSSRASSESPGWRFSLRRIRLGTTTCPLVEILVCMVRQSYLELLQVTRGCNPANLALSRQSHRMRITSYENLDNALGFKQVEMPRRLLLGINH